MKTAKTTTEQIIADMLDESYSDERTLSQKIADQADWNYHIARSAIVAKWTTKRLEEFIISGRPVLCAWLKPNVDFFSCSALKNKVGKDDTSYKMLNSITSMHRQLILSMGVHKDRMEPLTEAEKKAMEAITTATDALAKAEDDAEQAMTDNGLTEDQTVIRLDSAIKNIDMLKDLILSIDTNTTKAVLVGKITSLQDKVINM